MNQGALSLFFTHWQISSSGHQFDFTGKRPATLTLTRRTSRLLSEGRSLAHIDGRVVFVAVWSEQMFLRRR